MRTLALVLVVAAAACGDATGPESLQFVLNRAKWDAKGPNTYAFEYQRSSCECLPEMVQRVRITVVNGEVTTVTSVPTGEPVTRPAFQITIDSLFAYLANTLQQDPYRMTIAYDAVLGYPTAVFVDYDRQMVDDEGGFSARLVWP
jgi:hypothetical protein